MKNKIIILFLFVFLLLPNVSVFAQDNATDETLEKNASIPIEDIQTKIINNTPNWVAKPLVSMTNFFENFRISNKEKAEIKKEIIKKQITELKVKVVVQNIDKNSVEEIGDQNINPNSPDNLRLVLKYVQLFFLILLIFILSSQIVFYVVSLLILISIIKIIWQKLA